MSQILRPFTTKAVNMATRWAICGSGKIANDFCACLKGLPASEHQIVAVATSASKVKAEEFAKKFDIPESYGSYDELLGKDNIDVVYVNSIHPFHVDLSLKFINDSKAVLCEKPMALSLEGCKKVLKAAKEKNVLFVEAYWSRFFPALNFIKEQCQSGNLGEIKVVQASFCIPIAGVPRILDLNLGGGGLMDIGCYTVLLADLVFGEKPEKIWADGVIDTEHGIDKGGVICLTYSKGRMANLTYSTETLAGNSRLTIRGTKGIIQIPDNFWCPNKVILNGEVKEFPLPVLQEKCNYWNSEGLTYEAQGVRHCLVNGLKESPNITHTDSETIMTILQKVLDTYGMKYNSH